MKSFKKINYTILSALMIFAFLAGCQQQKDYSKELKSIADKLVNAWNGVNIDSLDSIFDPGFVRTVNQEPDVKGVEGFKKAINDFRTAYPDLRLTIDNEVYAENSIAVRWVLTGTNTGPGQMPPTGKAVNVWGEAILHLANGKVTGEIVSYNNQSLMEQLGYTMMPPKGEKK
jgi:predicted ester cyclase